jgi:hypothetical protein
MQKWWGHLYYHTGKSNLKRFSANNTVQIPSSQLLRFPSVDWQDTPIGPATSA